jgi:hypothetical protein
MLRAVTFGEGTPIWTAALTGQLGTPAIAGVLTVVASSDGYVVAVESATGLERWRADPVAAGESYSEPAIASDTVVLTRGGQTVVAFDLATGAERWSVDLDAIGSPLVAGPVVYVATGSGGLVQIALDTGKELGRTSLPGSGVSAIGLSPDAIYVTAGGVLTALVPGSGSSAAHEALPPGTGSATLEDAGSAVPTRVEWSRDSGRVRLYVAPDGKLWALNLVQSRFEIYDPDGNLLETWGEPGSGAGQFDFQLPGEAFWHGAIDWFEDGSFVVAECGNARVQKFDANRNPVLSFGRRGFVPGNFLCPSGVIALPDGEILVSDVWPQDFNMHRFTVLGEHEKTIGNFRSPASLRRIGENAFLTAEQTASRLSVIDRNGKMLLRFGAPGVEWGKLGQPIDATADSAGNIYVADAARMQVLVYGPDGEFLGTVAGEDGAALTMVQSIIVAPDDSVYVAVFDDVEASGRILKLQLSLPEFATSSPVS